MQVKQRTGKRPVARPEHQSPSQHQRKNDVTSGKERAEREESGSDADEKREADETD